MIGVGPLLVGLLVLGVELASAFLASLWVMRRWGAGVTTVSSTLCHAIIITAFLLVVHIVPGMLRVLDRWSVVAASLLGLGIVWLVARRGNPGRRANPAAARRRTRRQDWIGWGAALVGVGLVAGFMVGYLHGEFGTVPSGIDALTFHLPDVASWIRTGSLWQIDQFVAGQAQGNYPNNGDVLFLFLVLPFKSALLVRAAMLPYLVLTALGVFAVARELSASRPAALSAAAAFCAIPSVAAPALIDTQTDTVMLFGFITGVALLIRHSRTEARFDFVLAGIALGIAFGTKWYGVPAVAVVLVMWAAGRRLTGEWARRVGRGLIGLLGLILAAGGFWLLRNLIESADPFFPARVAPFGVTIFPAPPNVVQQTAGFTIGDYLGAPHILGTYIVPALRDGVQWIGIFIAGSALLGGCLGIRDVQVEHDRGIAVRVILLTLTALLLAIAYVFTPDTALGPRNFPVAAIANVRYLMPALVVAAPVAAWLWSRLGPWTVVPQVAAIVLAERALAGPFGGHWKVIAAVTVIVILGGVGWELLRHSPRRSALARWVVPATVFGLLMLVLAGSAFRAQTRFSYRPYAEADPALAWVLANAPSGHTIGLAGAWSNDGYAPVLPALGPRLGNRVTYVGRFVRHLLQQYPSAKSFQAALKRERYDLLLIGLGAPNPALRVPAEAWAEAAGYRQVAQSYRFALLARR